MFTVVVSFGFTVLRKCSAQTHHTFTQTRTYKLTWVTWSCMHQAGSTACFPSGRGPSRRSCHQCGRSWHFQSWWHLCLGSVTQWGRTHRTAPCGLLPWGWGHGHKLDRKTYVLILSCCLVKYSRCFGRAIFNLLGLQGLNYSRIDCVQLKLHLYPCHIDAIIQTIWKQ